MSDNLNLDLDYYGRIFTDKNEFTCVHIVYVYIYTYIQYMLHPFTIDI